MLAMKRSIIRVSSRLRNQKSPKILSTFQVKAQIIRLLSVLSIVTYSGRIGYFWVQKVSSMMN